MFNNPDLAQNLLSPTAFSGYVNSTNVACPLQRKRDLFSQDLCNGACLHNQKFFWIMLMCCELVTSEYIFAFASTHRLEPVGKNKKKHGKSLCAVYGGYALMHRTQNTTPRPPPPPPPQDPS